MTSTAVAVVPPNSLSLAPEQSWWTDKQLAILTAIGVSGANDGDLAVFFHVCQRTGLDPFARQIYMIRRDGKQTIQTGIDGYRLIARRAADAVHHSLSIGQTEWCGEEGEWSDVWLSEKAPAAARVTVTRNGGDFTAVALWREYWVAKADGTITKMWQTRPAGQLGKCAEALALRKAFPQDLSGVYTEDEMANQPRDRVSAVVEPATGSERMGRILHPEPESDNAEPDRAMSAEQRGKMFAQFEDMGIGDDADAEVQRNYISDVIKRPCTEGKQGRNSLTVSEARAVIEAQIETLDQDQS